MAVAASSCGQTQEPTVSIEQAVEKYIVEPTNTRAVELIKILDQYGELSHTPYLLDFARMSGANSIRSQALAAVAKIQARELGGTPLEIGSDINGAYVELGGWILDSSPPPAPNYQAFKAVVYGKVEPAFSQLIGDVDDYATLVGIQWGGVAFGGIPELDNPARIPPSEAGWANDDELVYAVAVGSTVVAYPRRVIGKHELSNDSVVDPVSGETLLFSVSFCSLCRTAVAFNRVVDGQTLSFKTSGLLLNANKVMVDDQTGSMWQQATGHAISGPLAGSSLELLVTQTMGFEQFKQEYEADGALIVDLPEPYIVDPETGTLTAYDYQDAEPLADYVHGGRLWFPVAGTSGVGDPLSEVWTALVDGLPLAIDVEQLEARGSGQVTVGARTLLIISVGVSAQLLDITGMAPERVAELELLASTGGGSGVKGVAVSEFDLNREAIFRWLSVHPGTTRWPERDN